MACRGPLYTRRRAQLLAPLLPSNFYRLIDVHARSAWMNVTESHKLTLAVCSIRVGCRYADSAFVLRAQFAGGLAPTPSAQAEARPETAHRSDALREQKGLHGKAESRMRLILC